MRASCGDFSGEESDGRRESPGLGDTKLRMLRGANLAPSAISRIRCRLRLRGETAGEPSPKVAIGCNRLQFSIVDGLCGRDCAPTTAMSGRTRCRQPSDLRNRYNSFNPSFPAMVQFPRLRRGQDLAGWGRTGDSQRAPSAQASDLGASPCGRRPQPPLRCDLLQNHAHDASQ